MGNICLQTRTGASICSAFKGVLAKRIDKRHDETHRLSYEGQDGVYGPRKSIINHSTTNDFSIFDSPSNNLMKKNIYKKLS